MQDHEKVFQDYLATKGLKLTRPRALILNTVFDMHEHFDVEALYDKIKALTDSISRATVYRCIPLLIDANLIQQSMRTSSRDSYEHTFGHPRHIHWICSKCGTVVETDYEELAPLLNRSAKRIKFTMGELKLNIYGLCWKCQSTENENQ